MTEIIFYELPKLEEQLNNFLEGKAGVENLRKEEKWCMFMKYRHEQRAGELIEELCRKKEGIMRAEQAVTRISRDYIRYAKKMAGIKNSMDRAEELLLAREEAEEKGRQKGITEERLEIARKMKKAGRPLSEIEEFTGLQTTDYAD